MQGIWTALVTPFKSSGEIDFDTFKKNLDRQVQAGVTGVVVCGTTGESPTLTTDEKKQLIQTAVSHLQHEETQVLAGTGTNNTQQSIDLSVWSDQNGVDGVLVIAPYYNKPSQAGLEAHYLAIAEVVGCNVILYNAPSRTGVTIEPETVARLAKHPKIRGIKECTGSTKSTLQIRQLLRGQTKPFDVLCGDDDLFLPMLSIGASGLVSVASNLVPQEMVAIYNGFQKQAPEKVLSQFERLHPLFHGLFLESNPVPVKFCMSAFGYCEDFVRLPLFELSETSKKRLHQTLKECGLN